MKNYIKKYDEYILNVLKYLHLNIKIKFQRKKKAKKQRPCLGQLN